jgi:hypothetical protein
MCQLCFLSASRWIRAPHCSLGHAGKPTHQALVQFPGMVRQVKRDPLLAIGAVTREFGTPPEPFRLRRFTAADNAN